MRLKTRPGDFKVFERLHPDILQGKGAHRVYHVTKTKLTSAEAARHLAQELRIEASEVHMAGLKDRQGTTSQYMSVYHGRDVRWSDAELKIETAGFAKEALDSSHSEGNRFQIIVRDLSPLEIDRLRESLDPVREFGLPNYFDEQRFGNLRHGQGWIALDLLRGDTEGALKRLIASASTHDNRENRAFKEQLWRRWGDWRACRELAGRYGRHHSIFEHLKRQPDDFAGAFGRVSMRDRLIHLFAFQSHLWNRSVARFLDDRLDENDRFAIRSLEGKMVFPRGAMPVEDAWGGRFPLPGPQLQGVDDHQARWLLTHALEKHQIAVQDFDIPDVPGFGFKAEPRSIAVIPEGLRARPAEPDPLHPGKKRVTLEFSLPRGSYATLVVRRLVGPTVMDDYRGPGMMTDPYARRREGPRGRGGPRRGGSRGRGHYEGGYQGGGHREGGYQGGGQREGGYQGGGQREGGYQGGGQREGGYQGGGHREGGYQGGGHREGGYQGGGQRDGGYQGGGQREGGYQGGGQREGGYQGGGHREGGYQGGGQREGGYQGGGQREGGYRDGGHRDGGYRDSGSHEGSPRGRGPRGGGPRRGGPRRGAGSRGGSGGPRRGGPR